MLLNTQRGRPRRDRVFAFAAPPAPLVHRNVLRGSGGHDGCHDAKGRPTSRCSTKAQVPKHGPQLPGVRHTARASHRGGGRRGGCHWQLGTETPRHPSIYVQDSERRAPSQAPSRLGIALGPAGADRLPFHWGRSRASHPDRSRIAGVPLDLASATRSHRTPTTRGRAAPQGRPRSVSRSSPPRQLLGAHDRKDSRGAVCTNTDRGSRRRDLAQPARHRVTDFGPHDAGTTPLLTCHRSAAVACTLRVRVDRGRERGGRLLAGSRVRC